MPTLQTMASYEAERVHEYVWPLAMRKMTSEVPGYNASCASQTGLDQS